MTDKPGASNRLYPNHPNNMRSRTCTLALNRKATPAFTIVELLLAMSIMAVIGVAALTILGATTYGTSDDQERRQMLVNAEVIKQRFNGAIRSAKELIVPSSSQTTSTDYFIVWANDTNDDDTKDNNEMVLVERDTSNNELHAYQNTSATGTFTDAASFRTAALASYPSTRWAIGFSALSCTGAFGTGQLPLVTYKFTLTRGTINESHTGSASLRQ